MIDHSRVVQGTRGDAETLRTTRHGWVVYRLDVDIVLTQQEIARRTALLWITNENWDDVRVS